MRPAHAIFRLGDVLFVLLVWELEDRFGVALVDRLVLFYRFKVHLHVLGEEM